MKKHHSHHEGLAMKAKHGHGRAEHPHMSAHSGSAHSSAYAPQHPMNIQYPKTGRPMRTEYPDTESAIHRDQEESIRAMHSASIKPGFRH